MIIMLQLNHMLIPYPKTIEIDMIYQQFLRIGIMNLFLKKLSNSDFVRVKKILYEIPGEQAKKMLTIH